MRRKDDAEQLKKKQTIKQQTFDFSYQTEISILLPYLKLMPTTMRSKFVVALTHHPDKETLSDPYKSALDKIVQSCAGDNLEPSKNGFLVNAFCRYLKLNRFKQHNSLALKKQPTKQAGKDKPQDPSWQKQCQPQIQPFEPSPQKSSHSIDPIPQIINPNYQNLTKMYKNFTDIHMNTQYKIKDLNENYTFFAQPRLITKLLEIHDFQSGFSEKGNIVMISFQGTKIVGKRGFAFVSASAIYWWEKNYKHIKDILPEFIQDKQKDQKTQKNQKKPQPQPDPKPEQPTPSYSNTPMDYTLSYKILGHHGKITSLSLSDDEYYLLSAGTDQVVKLWCLRQKCLLAQYRGHLGTIWSVGFCPSGYYFLTGGADRFVKLWATDDSIPQRVYAGHLDDVVKVDFLKNPDIIASASEDKTIRLWNTLTTECLNILSQTSSPTNFKNSISGRYLISSDTTGKLTLYDLLKGQTLSTFRIPQKQQSPTPSSSSSSSSSSQCPLTSQSPPALQKYLPIHDMCFSQDEREFSCISGKYIIIYSLDKICEKQSRCLFSEVGRDRDERVVATKEVIYTGRDSNLVYCAYSEKGVLLVATTSGKKY